MNIFRRFSALVLVQLVLALSMSQLAIAQTTVTVDKVIELLELEVKEEKIIALLEGSPTQFTLGEDQIAKLKKAGTVGKSDCRNAEKRPEGWQRFGCRGVYRYS